MCSYYPSYCDTPYSPRAILPICPSAASSLSAANTHVRGDVIKVPTLDRSPPSPPYISLSRLLSALIRNGFFNILYSFHCTHNTLYYCSHFIVPNPHRHAPIIRQMRSMSVRPSPKMLTSTSALTSNLMSLAPPPSWSLSLSSRPRWMWVYCPK